MNRRDFLQRASLAVAAMAIDPERLLWTPGQKTIFLPPTKRLRHLTFAEILAVTYDQVLAERYRINHQWADSPLLVELERMGAITT